MFSFAVWVLIWLFLAAMYLMLRTKKAKIAKLQAYYKDRVVSSMPVMEAMIPERRNPPKPK